MMAVSPSFAVNPVLMDFDGEDLYLVLAEESRPLRGAKLDRTLGFPEITYEALFPGKPSAMDLEMSLLLLAYPNGTLVLADLETGQERLLAHQNEPIEQIEISGNETYGVLRAGNELMIHELDFDGQLWRRRYPGNFAFAAGSAFLVTIPNKPPEIRLFDLEDSSLLRTFSIEAPAVQMDFAADRYLILADAEQRVTVYDFTVGGVEHSLGRLGSSEVVDVEVRAPLYASVLDQESLYSINLISGATASSGRLDEEKPLMLAVNEEEEAAVLFANNHLVIYDQALCIPGERLYID